jgi:hypothetical protein
MGKGPVTLAFAGSGDSMLYSNPREASEAGALCNSCSELRVAHRDQFERILRFLKLLGMLLVGRVVWLEHIDGY